ncbi:MAG: hypothetical protein KGY56_02275 [Desulfobacterales bacterium]|nr:hypothetical protein [Desulfobacterales bacterium]
MPQKILIPLYGREVAPRFDLAAEAVFVTLNTDQHDRQEKLVVLPQVSAEKLCHMILTEGMDTVICGGIEEEYYQYLTWKRIAVYDGVIGPWEKALERLICGALRSGDIITASPEADTDAG